MRHRIKKNTLGRQRAQRVALMKSLAESLVLHDSIVTTKAKAKALKTFVEPLVTKAKKGDLVSRRRLISALFTDKVVNKLMDEIGPRYKERPGGYTRITNIGYRPNDGAEKVRIEFI
ncbi:MAG: 50S ribosomal protein L17 [Candidatus Magasanikbacteria bacterium CG_4_10_14_0_2_um_filter_37_12]|uniref:Large ribosomal subunit protein bL17 n=1 Tax=Candidatus Magasanikbacteria bacterium CG_4_10_14_0_2_um_filter_37_12 TaxID=1974637 RepID=A0A2M7V8Y3_9BACT|nr:MAG: 50S ribosomal protein L17 [Candidatus Magasanikbacteria bacterium CG_4_10_14_0_2_um_filter_37_12]